MDPNDAIARDLLVAYVSAGKYQVPAHNVGSSEMTPADLGRSLGEAHQAIVDAIVAGEGKRREQAG